MDMYFRNLSLFYVVCVCVSRYVFVSVFSALTFKFYEIDFEKKKNVDSVNRSKKIW